MGTPRVGGAFRRRVPPAGVPDGLRVARERARGEPGRRVRGGVRQEIDRIDALQGRELRLRRAGWEIRRLDAGMTWHDAAITRFSQ